MVFVYAVAGLWLGASDYARAFPLQWTVTKYRATLSNTPVPDTTWLGTRANLAANWHFRSAWNRIGGEFRNRMAWLHLDPAVSEIVKGGTVDDIPYQLSIVPANGWQWKPRPILHSYSAYTPTLDKLNAAHLASRESADHIIMQWEDIDDRNPLLDDAASWRSLFDHYDVALARPEFLVLRRRDSARYLDPRPSGSTVAAWNQVIQLPQANQGEFALMQAHIDKNVRGAAYGLLFRNSWILMFVTRASGKEERWRVTRANLVDGVLIGTLPRTVSETLPYFGQPEKSQADRVVTIRFDTADVREFSPEIQISWFTVTQRPSESSQVSPRRRGCTCLRQTALVGCG